MCLYLPLKTLIMLVSRIRTRLRHEILQNTIMSWIKWGMISSWFNNMEFYQRVKQKLADELEAESPLEYPEGKIIWRHTYEILCTYHKYLNVIPTKKYIGNFHHFPNSYYLNYNMDRQWCAKERYLGKSQRCLYSFWVVKYTWKDPSKAKKEGSFQGVSFLDNIDGSLCVLISRTMCLNLFYVTIQLSDNSTSSYICNIIWILCKRWIKSQRFHQSFF